MSKLQQSIQQEQNKFFVERLSLRVSLGFA